MKFIQYPDQDFLVSTGIKDVIGNVGTSIFLFSCLAEDTKLNTSLKLQDISKYSVKSILGKV